MRMKVINTITSRHWDLIFGIEKSPNGEDQYTAVIAICPPNSIQKASKGEIVGEIGRYIVETGSLDELLKYKEVGAFSEWPVFRFSYSINQNLELDDRDMKFVKWMEKTLKEYVPKPEMKVEHGSRIWRATHRRRKKPWWKRLLGTRRDEEYGDIATH